MIQDRFSPNGVDTDDTSTEQIKEITELTASLPERYADSTTAIKGELATVIHAIETWEKLAPQLYMMRKRLSVIDEILSGKRNVEAISSLPSSDAQPEKKKRGPAKGSRVFTKKKSDILTDEVIDKIREFIASDESYHKAKDIYGYLVRNNIIAPFPGDTPERAFAIGLARVDQDVLKYNDHYTVMAWGLPDFGSPEHARRKALKSSSRGDSGTRIKSYGRGEAVEA
jgi:hypothetical protein